MYRGETRPGASGSEDGAGDALDAGRRQIVAAEGAGGAEIAIIAALRGVIERVVMLRQQLCDQFRPLPGIGEPDELANLMAWLLSDQAARVTGQVWSLDGGFSTIRPLVK